MVCICKFRRDPLHMLPYILVHAALSSKIPNALPRPLLLRKSLFWNAYTIHLIHTSSNLERLCKNVNENKLAWAHIFVSCTLVCIRSSLHFLSPFIIRNRALKIFWDIQRKNSELTLSSTLDFNPSLKNAHIDWIISMIHALSFPSYAHMVLHEMHFTKTA